MQFWRLPFCQLELTTLENATAECGTMLVAGPGLEPGTSAYETERMPFPHPAIVWLQEKESNLPDEQINSLLAHLVPVLELNCYQ